MGREPLRRDDAIFFVPANWADHLAGSQQLAHNPDYGEQILEVRQYRYAGENVGRGGDEQILFDAYMDSPGHRANIESERYQHLSVACIIDDNGQIWNVQNFWGV